MTIVRDLGPFILTPTDLSNEIGGLRIELKERERICKESIQKREIYDSSFVGLELAKSRRQNPDFFHRFPNPNPKAPPKLLVHALRALLHLSSRPVPHTLSIMADDTSKPPSPSPTPNSAIPNDPSLTNYDPSKPWSNIYNILTNRMSPVGKFHYREDSYIKNEKQDCTNCEEWRDWLFKYSPMIIFLQKNIRDLNGDLNASNVRCRRCPARLEEDDAVEEGKGDGKAEGEKPIKVYRQGGGFSPDHGILICANEMRNKKHLEDTLAHEMVHAWDHLRWKVDWADLRHAACTEVYSYPAASKD
jgi:inner membrane protease ATP23